MITGASRGIGAAMARAFVEEGSHVHLVARSEATHDVAAELGARATAWIADVTDDNAVARMAAGVMGESGPPHVVVNNAGSGRYLFVEETTPQEARDQIASPYLAAFFVTRAFLPGMLGLRRGRIVNVTSPAARIPWPGATGYSAARWAMRGFNAALVADLHGTGVGTTLVTPGKVSSSYFQNDPASEMRVPGATKLVPTVTPDQVARAVVRGVARDSSSVVLPWQLRWLFALHHVLPGPIDALIVRTGWRRDSTKAQ